jgi:hypothetical protein
MTTVNPQYAGFLAVGFGPNIQISSVIAGNALSITTTTTSLHGYVTLAGANTYSGGTTIGNAVNITASNNLAFGTGPVTAGPGFTLSDGTGVTLANNFSSGANTFYEAAGSGTIALTGNLTGSGTFDKDGSSTLVQRLQQPGRSAIEHYRQPRRGGDGSDCRRQRCSCIGGAGACESGSARHRRDRPARPTSAKIIAWGVSLGLCQGDGSLHIAYDHHNHTLRYRSTAPSAATTPSTVRWSPELFGKEVSVLVPGMGPVKGVSYPAFIDAPGGAMQLAFRRGQSGDGSWWLFDYDPALHAWKSGWQYDHGRLVIAAASASGDWTAWQVHDAAPGPFGSEPLVDDHLLKDREILSVFMQKSPRRGA